MLFGRFSSSMGLVGVDISDGATRLLQLREQTGALQVVGAGRIDLAPVPDGQLNPVALIERLRAAMTSGGFAGRKCIVSLPRGVVRLQAIRLPRMPDAELRQAVLWEAAQRFGIPRDHLAVDFIRTGLPTKPAENREELLLIALAHQDIYKWLEPLMSAGFRPVAIETEFTALARLFSRRCRREADRGVVRAVVDIGRTGSTVLILCGDQIAFCKPILIGGRQFDHAVAEHLQLEEHAAAELRSTRIAAVAATRSAESATDAATERAVFEAVRPLMGDLVKEVSLCLRYYGVTFRGNPPERMILTGEDGLEPRLDEAFAQSCKLPVSLDDDVSTLAQLIAQVRTSLNREPGPAQGWAAAAGLSLRGLMRAQATRRLDDPHELANSRSDPSSRDAATGPVSALEGSSNRTQTRLVIPDQARPGGPTLETA